MGEPCFTFEEYCDDLGPAKIVHLYDPTCGLRGIVVIDNVPFDWRGPHGSRCVDT